jgi:hypothetical protein
VKGSAGSLCIPAIASAPYSLNIRGFPGKSVCQDRSSFAWDILGLGNIRNNLVNLPNDHGSGQAVPNRCTSLLNNFIEILGIS